MARYFSLYQQEEEVYKNQKNTWTYLLSMLVVGCSPMVEDKYRDEDRFTDSGSTVSAGLIDTVPLIADHSNDIKTFPAGSVIETKNITPQSVVAFAQTLIGRPYKFGSKDPAAGFDCSGFITYVFNHFDIAVPRSSVDFTNVGKEVHKTDAKPGDLILFTGTNPSIRKVGHMGIVTFNNRDTLFFIHSTSGKLYSVTVTPLNEYYQSRFVKIIRIFDENNNSAARR